jgi:cytochrome c-type biogenesis protein CcmH
MRRISGLIWCLLLIFGSITVSAEEGLIEASYDYSDPEFKSIVNMLSMEGHATDDLSSCNVKQLYYQEVADMLNKGMKKDEILDFYVSEQGVKALLAPPNEGFNISLWVTPFLLIFAVFILLFFLIKKWKKNNATLNRNEEQVEQDDDDIYESMIENERKKLI